MAANSVERFYLQPTAYSPNSRLPILLYRAVLPQPYTEQSTSEFLQANDWEKNGTWGAISVHHYHPNVHECYGIFQGSSTLILGRGKLDEKGGIYLPVYAGDVLVLPAGTTHCSLNSESDYKYIAVYPKGAPHWRSEYGETHTDMKAMIQAISTVAMPTQDPVYGKDGPLVQLWNREL